MPDERFTTGDRIVVAGASGLIGRALVARLRASGAEVTRLVRRAAVRPDEIAWNPADGLDRAVLAGARAVVVLNGASIGHLPWTESYRSQLIWSRLTPIRAVARAIEDVAEPRPQLVTASAVGYYGSRPGRRMTEDAEPGSGFLADMCVVLEEAARDAEDITTVTRLRIAPVIHPKGVLAPLMTLTALGVSGPLGSGKQIWPWISLDDTVAAIEHVITTKLAGAVNLVGPTPASANDIGFALAVAMNRPYLVRAPRFALRAALGDAADGLLLADADVIPAALDASGFMWRIQTAEEAVRRVVAEAQDSVTREA